MEQLNTQALTPEHRHWIGMRIIKTVVAVFLCGLLAYFREASGFYSMIAAVVCVQNTAGKTIESSVNRMVGTLIGVFIMSVLKTGLSNLNLQAPWQTFFTGLVVIGAVLLDIQRTKAANRVKKS